MSNNVPLRVFISYEIGNGAKLAETVFKVFQDIGVSGWVWHLHRRAGSYLRTEIAERIGEADYVLFLCTQGTLASEGQRFEINNATNRNKEIWVMTLDDAFVPPVLLGYVYEPATPETVGTKCQEMVERIGQPTWPVVRNAPQIVTDETADLT